MLPSWVKGAVDHCQGANRITGHFTLDFLRFREITDDALFIFSIFEESPLLIEFESMP